MKAPKPGVCLKHQLSAPLALLNQLQNLTREGRHFLKGSRIASMRNNFSQSDYSPKVSIAKISS